MIVNPGKFQLMVINRFGKMENKHEVYIDNQRITSEHSIELLGIEIDDQLNFEKQNTMQKSRFPAKYYF